MGRCQHVFVTVKAKPGADGRWDATQICAKCGRHKSAVVDRVPLSVARCAIIFSQTHSPHGPQARRR